MTLEQFLNVTAEVPEPVLRSAMVVALSMEPARTPETYRRFYDRVIHELGLDALPRSAVGRGPWAETGVSAAAGCSQPPADADRSDNGPGRCS
jgi:hypothetical protein